MKKEKKGKTFDSFIINVDLFSINRYRRLEEMMNAEGLSEQEVNL